MRTANQLAHIMAADKMDWQQVILNGAPPCFHICDDGKFCGRADRWTGIPTTTNLCRWRICCAR